MNKLLVVSAIAALGLSSVAFAGGLPEEMPTAPAAVSSDAGFYLGIAGGYGMTNWKNLEGLAVNGTKLYSISKDNGAVGRAFLGYDLNRYFAVEFGYSYFFNKPTMDLASGVTNGPFGITASGTKFIKNTQAFDLMGKIKAPVVDNFDLYAKLGVNYLISNLDNVTISGNSSSIRNLNVAFGAGADYYITPNIIANIEWLRFNGKAKFDFNTVTGGQAVDYQPNTDAFMVGLRYKFDM